MQTNMGDLRIKNDESYYVSPQRNLQPRRLDSAWDYVSSPIIKNMRVKDDEPSYLNLNSRSQSVNVEMADFDGSYHFGMTCHQMSQDMENQSTQPSSLISRQSSGEYMSEERVCSNGKISAKCNAPVKTCDTQKYKLAAEQIYRDQISKPSFISRLNNCYNNQTEKQMNSEYEERSCLFTHKGNDMSLEDHLEALSNRYSRQKSNSQDYIKIFDSQVSMSVDSEELPNESECTKLTITLPASTTCADYFKECFDLTENAVNESGSNFIQRLNKLL